MSRRRAERGKRILAARQNAYVRHDGQPGWRRPGSQNPRKTWGRVRG